MFATLLTIAPLFLIVFGAAIFQRFQKVDESWSTVLNSFALNVGLPALIFSALARADLVLSEQGGLLLANSLFLLLGFALTFVATYFLRLRRQLCRTLFICLAFGNVAYLGIPILTQVFGQSVVPTASLIVATYLFWIFTVGVGFLDYSQHGRKKETIKKLLSHLARNPNLIAVVLGLAVAGLGITLPKVILQPIEMLSASVTPVVLVVIGLFIGSCRLGRLRDWLPSLFFSLATLLIMPALFYFLLRLLGFSTHLFAVSIIEAAMPLAITPFALAEQFDLDKKFIVRSIVLSTILSVLTTPFWISVL